MSTIGFSRFGKQFASAGITTPLTDAQASAGWSFLGTSPPTVEEFNAMMQTFDDKDNWLFNNIVTLQTTAGVAAPADGDFTTLTKAVIAMFQHGVALVTLTSSGGTYSLANAQPITAYANGQKFRAIVNATNGAAPLINVDAVGAIPIVGMGANGLQGGELLVNEIAEFSILIAATINGGNPVAFTLGTPGGGLQVATATQSQHAVNFGQAQGLQGNYRTVLALNTSQALTVAQISGVAINWFGASGGVLTLPSAATILTGVGLKIYNYGAGTLVINVAGGTDFLYAGFSVTSVTLAHGDDIEITGRASVEVDITGGSAMRQFNPLIVGAATAATHAIQLQQANAAYAPISTIGNQSGSIGFTGNGAIPSGGKFAEITAGANLTITLPAPASGACIPFYNNTNSPHTLQTPGGQLINNGSTGSSTYAVRPWAALFLLSDGASWTIIAGAGDILSSTNGWERKPSGLIECWGSGTTNGSGVATITLPIAFPSSQILGMVCGQNGTAIAACVTLQSLSTTTIIINATNGSAAAISGLQVNFRALGK